MPRNPVPSDHRPPRTRLEHVPVPATNLPDESVTAQYTVPDQFGNRRVRLPSLGSDKNPRLRGTPGTATAGHPTVLSDIMAERILTAIRGGNPRGTAARWAGISAHAFSSWMSRPEPRFAIFAEMVLEAEARAKVAKLQEATPTLADGVSAQERASNAWKWLEKRDREHFARDPARVQVNIGTGVPTDVDYSAFSVEELRLLRTLALKLAPDTTTPAAPHVIDVTPDAPAAPPPEEPAP